MLTSKIDLRNGVPTLFVNDEVVVNVMCEGDGEFVSSFKPAGINIYKFSGPKTRGQASMGWDGADNFDYSQDEQIMAGILNQDPDGYLMPYIGHIDAVPELWQKNHPEAMSILSNGQPGLGPSAASEPFACISETLIKRYIEHFENSIFKDRIMGYHVANGRSYEWLSWNWLQKEEKIFDDYSEPMLIKFRQWLEKKYLCNVDALRDAWKDGKVTFETANIPTLVRRLKSNENFQVPDYHACYAQSWADLAMRFCHTAKDAVNRSKVIGIFHGYLFLNCHNTYIQQIGHLAFSKLLKSPDIDIYFAPYCYENRGVRGCHFPQVCESSLVLHNKMFIDQIDTRTSIVDPKQPQWGQSDSIEESLDIMKRDIGASITHGSSYYWFDMESHVYESNGTHWYDHPELKSMLKKLTDLSNDALLQDTRSNAEIALFVDEESYLREKPDRAFHSLYITAQRQYELDKIATPFDSYLLSDLPNIRDYKFYIFLNAFVPSDKVLSSLKRRIYKTGATSLWFYSPMCYDEMSPAPEKTAEKIGIKLAMDRKKDFIHIDIVDHEHPYTAGLEHGFNYGSDIDPASYIKTTAFFPNSREEFKFSPIFYSSDPQAQTLGVIRANKQPGLVTTKWGAGNVVYSAAPLMPAKLIRNIASESGVHIYSEDDDLVYANNIFLFITSRTSGMKKLKLPSTCNITDALSGEKISMNCQEFSISMNKNETRIFNVNRSF
jgi:hypothetical protein